MSSHDVDRGDRRRDGRRRERRRLAARRGAALALLVGVTALVFGVALRSGSSASQAHRMAAEPPVRRHVAPARLGPRQRALSRAVAWARRQRGMHEIGTTNCSPAIDRWERHMGLDVPAAPPCRPWCGAFVHEAFLQGGLRLSSRLIDPNQSYWDARRGANGLERIPTSAVRPGDILFFALDPGVQASHEALVIGRPHDGRVLTAEGNVGHHAVVTRRGLRYAVLAARVTRRPSRT